MIKKLKNRFVPQFLYEVVKSYFRLNINKLSRDLALVEDGCYLAIHHPDWLGVSIATRELFKNIVSLPDLYSKRKARRVTDLLLKKKIKMCIFSGFANGWEHIAEEMKKVDASVTLKVIWHGGNSLHVEQYDWNRFQKVFDLHDRGIVHSICFVKKSMAMLYASKGYRTEHLMNNVYITPPKTLPIRKNQSNEKIVRIGLYVSGDRWVKNMFNQLAAISLIPNAVADCIPLNKQTIQFAGILHLPIEGEWGNIPREDLHARMARNDVNIYTTFSECAPLIPLESFELGVPCITGNNHHYWDDSELRQYVVVDEVDNPYAISEKIRTCLTHRGEILKVYQKWKSHYDTDAEKSLQMFLKD